MNAQENSHKSKVEQEMSEAVAKQFEKQVAFYNIGGKHAFFFCSPDEARYAMDAVREFRENGKSREISSRLRDDMVERILKEKPWENKPRVKTVSTSLSPDGTLTVSDLNRAFSIIESGINVKGAMVDAIILSGMRFADIRYWGKFIYDDASKKDREERRVFAYVFGADVYVFSSNEVPDDVVICASLPVKGKNVTWSGDISFVEVVSTPS